MKTQTNTQWTTCQRKLLLNGKTFFVRGVNYAPTPIGRPGRLDMLDQKDIFTRDLKNLRGMHANAVKTYDFYSSVEHTPFLDAAYNDGVNSVYTVFSIWIDQSLMEPVIPADSEEFQHLVQAYYEMAKLTSGHPGIMGYSIGGEMNSIVVVHDKDFWHKFGLLTDAVRRGMKENDAHKVITTTFVDDAGASFLAGEQFSADVDMWGSNVYQTDYPGSVIPAYMRVPGNKPLLISEYGMPYATDKAEGSERQLEMVAKLLTRQTIAMQQNFNLTDVLHEQVVVGGFVFEYSDEWWKAGAESVHDLGLLPNDGFPLGFLSEEYFGLFRIERPEDPDSVDIVQARPTVDILTSLWSNAKLGGEGEDYSDCKAMMEATSPNMRVSLEQMTDPAQPEFTSRVIGNVFLVAIVCILSVLAFVAFTTKVRRHHYQPLETTSTARPARRDYGDADPPSPRRRTHRASHDRDEEGPERV